MILLDVNVLVYAFRGDTAHHTTARAWLTRTLSSERVGLCDPVVSGFVRIVTNRRAFAEPDRAGDAIGFVEALASSGAVSFVQGGTDAVSRFAELARDDHGLKANVVPDAWIAATAMAHGAAVASFDTDFRRFPRLRFIHIDGDAS